MKLLEFKNYITERLMILKINVVNSYQIETAYFTQGWSNMLSTVFWTLTYIVFLHVIFANVKVFGGYSKNEILLLTLIGQCTFYAVWAWGLDNVGTLIDNINSGALDIVLTKPLPALFYVSLKNISIVGLLRDGLPSLTILALVVDWSQLNFHLLNIITAFFVFIFGQISAQSFMFIISLTAFWTGNGRNTLWIGFDILDSVNNIPYEGLGMKTRVLFTSLLPVAISTGLTTSVLLGKSDPVIMFCITVLVATIFTVLKIKAWNIALKNYSSASS